MNHTLNIIDILKTATLNSDWLTTYAGTSNINNGYVFTHSMEPAADSDDIQNNTIGFGFGPDWNLTLQTISMTSATMLEQVHILVYFSKLIDDEKNDNENFELFSSDIKNWINDVLLTSNIRPSELTFAEPFEVSEYAKKIEKMTVSLSIKMPYMKA